MSPYKIQWSQILLGPLNENLRIIEKHYAVTIYSQNDHLIISGSLEARNAVSDLITALYAHVQTHNELTTRDVHQAIFHKPKKKNTHSTEHDLNDEHFLHVGKRRVKLANEDQMRYINAMHDHTIVFALGPAGTGKTFLAIAYALSQLMKSKVEKIVLVRPVVDAGEKLGFLPGDMNEKVDPYLRPFYDELNHLLGKEQIDVLFEQKKIEIAPIAFMRGRTLSDAFIILDEAQNTSVEQMKMLLTRIGHGSKMSIGGDLGQSDLPAHTVSGLDFADQALKNVDSIATVFFSIEHNTRHPLIPKILHAFENYKKNKD